GVADALARVIEIRRRPEFRDDAVVGTAGQLMEERKAGPERAQRVEGRRDAPAGRMSRSGPRCQCGSACGRTVLTSAVATIGRKRTNRQNIVKKRPKLPSRHDTSQIVGRK